MSDQPRQPSYIGQAWLVILLALVYGGALAGVETTLGPLIAENKMNETYEKIPELVPGADRAKTIEVNRAQPFEVEGADGNRHRVYPAVAADGARKGWVLPASGQGFADRIELLIGLDAEVSTITGLYVLDQKETPGLGDRIKGPQFREQFKDQPTEAPLVVNRNGAAGPGGKADGRIVALTGATISSESVAKIVNDALGNWKEPIRRLDTAGAEEAAPKRNLQ